MTTSPTARDTARKRLTHPGLPHQTWRWRGGLTTPQGSSSKCDRSPRTVATRHLSPRHFSGVCRCALHTPRSPPCSDCPTHRTRHPTSEIHPPVTAPPTSSLAWGSCPRSTPPARLFRRPPHTRLSSALDAPADQKHDVRKQHIWKHVPAFLQATAVPLRTLRRPPQNNRPPPHQNGEDGNLNRTDSRHDTSELHSGWET